MPNLRPYDGPTKLVLAFDIGTAFSGISYCILERGRVPEILGVTRFPGQGPVSGDARVPSLLYYDKSGNVRTAGAETLTETAIESALTEGWNKAEWWMLHLSPKRLAPIVNKDDDLPPLPPGKTAIRVLTDFIKYLSQCARTYIEEHHLAFSWSCVQGSIEYIFTHPNGWDGTPQLLYRRAIELAGIVPSTPQGRSRIHLLTMGEASLHFCITNLCSGPSQESTPQGVVIIDAGDGTIDLSMFLVTSNPISCEEMAPAECRLQGSIFVSRQARALIQRKLDGWEHSTPGEIDEFVREFDQTTKLVIKSDQEPAYVRVAGRRCNNPKYSISFGKLKLTGEEATGLFNESFDAIISAFEKQQKSATAPITIAFFLGELSTNDWLWYRLQSYFKDKDIKICRPDNHINKAVSNGAVLSLVDRENHGITSQASYRRHLEHFGDIAASAERHDKAIGQSPEDLLIKRSKAYLTTGAWEKALNDANQAIALNPSLAQGYEMKHAALHKRGDYDNAIVAFEVMLSKLEQSPDPAVRQLVDRYVRPSKTRTRIQKLVNTINRRLPRELINATNGRLYDRAARLSAFESSPIYKELVSSMTTRVNNGRIKREVRQYFRYVMFSHKWEDGEPSFQDVIHISVYNLGKSPTCDKLKTFCKIVRDGGFVWAWSDVCCINKSDHFILQEALVAMFKWYEGSTLTIVYLRGVHSLSQLGALVRSIWNKRAWTLQEYIAAKVVHFYTEDWTPYLGLQLLNHKKSQEVMSEMEEATGIPAEELTALRPGLRNIREKLRLASTRETTYQEDAAYSLLGIFAASGIPAIYGDGSAALGRLLANVLARSGDVGILAWSGDSGRFNSCLPSNIAVFNGPVTTHLPQHLPVGEMETIISTSQTNPFDVDTALRLYDRLRNLPVPRFSESRMTLPCITFRLPRFSLCRSTDSLRTYRVNTDAFGMVEVRTKSDLTRYGTLYLVHPWLETLFGREDVHGGAFEQPPPSPASGDEDMDDEMIDEGASDDAEDLSSLLENQSLVLPSPVGSPVDEETRARRLVARLRQPFGALLFRVTAADQRVVTYKRVAADSLFNVKLQESFPLARILERVGTVDVL